MIAWFAVAILLLSIISVALYLGAFKDWTH